jgi:hypothetical protein
MALTPQFITARFIIMVVMQEAGWTALWRRTLLPSENGCQAGHSEVMCGGMQE